MTTDRERLVALLNALDASETTLQRDLVRYEGRTGDLAIYGTLGHIYPDGAGFLLYVTTEEVDKQGHVTSSPRRWFNVKARLAGICRLTQDGDDEGCFYLDHLPTAIEAEAIREALGIRKRRKMTDEARAQLEAARKAAKSASGNHMSI